MINVLIVEDDQLVRKGLLFALPWSDFDMQVVGEANNGKKALEFLEDTAVHLIITDLSMPVMPGIEFMRVVRERYPQIQIAVLTLHHDFDYVQEALRLGAIDFITKVEMEKENFAQILGRLHQRMRQETQRNDTGVKETYFQTDVGFAVFFNCEKKQKKWMKDAANGQFFIHQVDNTFSFCVPYQEMNPSSHHELKNKLQKVEGCFCVEVRGIMDRFYNEVYRLMQDYRDKLLFYKCSQNRYLVKKIRDMEKDSKLSLKDISTVKKNLSTFQWVYEEEEFQGMVEELKSLYLPKERLYHLMTELIEEWNNQRWFLPAAQYKEELNFEDWKDVHKWLSEFRFTVKMTAGTGYASDVVNSILQALNIIQGHMKEGLTADEAARSVSMSRSYFNKCFKDIVGQSFHQYLREIRIQKAKTMIEETNESLQWIAEQVGYLDEKYFSRVFRQQTGFLPSEYRRKFRKRQDRLK
ncbi:response regulator transcription factor [Halobacillus andaensis]|uniref:response regulator transcription factor n=1 Tax=Halobacillus andaensis TaxID=1176239 RepID=UPI003D70B7A4